MDHLKVQAALSSMLAQGNGAPSSASAPGSAQQQQQQQQQLQAAAPPPATSQLLPPGSSAREPASLEAMLSQAQNAQNGDRGNNQHHPVAEFLYQLTKMLTDDNNEIIEWVDGRIKVHHPERLEAEVLHKYFRHSKFASFQRQLNYFGFRKIAGKGKMSPCSYVNESATSDIRSLLVIKRKTNGSAARKAMAQRALSIQGNMNPALGTGLPGLASAPGPLSGLGGLGALSQLQAQKQFSAGLLGAHSDNPLSQFLAQNQRQQSWNDLQQLSGLKQNLPSIEQLQAQLASLSQQQNQGSATAALNAAALSMANGANLAQLQHSDNPATAALNAMPSTTATAQSNNLFESAANLKALIGNDQNFVESLQAKASGPASGVSSNHVLNRLPSSSGLFPGFTSSASLGNLLASSNRLNSLLSLNSFLSREPSLADFAKLPNGAQLAALQQQQQQSQQDWANLLNQQSA